MEKRETLCIVIGNVNWYNHYEKPFGGFSKKLKIELPYLKGTILSEMSSRERQILYDLIYILNLKKKKKLRK